MSDTKTPAPVHPLLEGTTPGEWFLPEMAGPYHVPGTTASGKGDWCYYINSQSVHGFCPASAHGPTAEEAKANAKLIAMAPTLAAENARLRAALEALVRHSTESHMCYPDCVDNAREVLASLTT